MGLKKDCNSCALRNSPHGYCLHCDRMIDWKPNRLFLVADKLVKAYRYRLAIERLSNISRVTTGSVLTKVTTKIKEYDKKAAALFDSAMT